MPGTWQLSFGDGHQQRYPASRPAVLRYTLGIGPKAASTRFEVYAESGAVSLADGQPGERTFALAEVTGLSRGKQKGFRPSSSTRLTRERKVCGTGCHYARNRPHSKREAATFRGERHERSGAADPPHDHSPDAGSGPAQGERRAAMQQAVIKVIRHLVLKAVPPEHRTPSPARPVTCSARLAGAWMSFSKRSRRGPSPEAAPGGKHDGPGEIPVIPRTAGAAHSPAEASADTAYRPPRRPAGRSPLHQALRSRTASRARVRPGSQLSKTWEKVVKRGQ